jgi:translation initiation factor 6
LLIQTQLLGKESLGVYCRATDDHCLVPPNLPDSALEEAEDALETTAKPITIGGTGIVGALTAMNSNGILVSDIATEREIKQLEELGLEVGQLEGAVNAAGNAVLCNDHGAVVDPRFPEELLSVIEETLDVDVEIGTVGGVRTPAAAALVTNNGALLHPKATEAEVATVEQLLDVDSMPGTVNHGSPYVGSGVVANTAGALIGSTTTGPEMNRLEDALGYLD